MREKLLTLMFREHTLYPPPQNTVEFIDIIRRRIEDSCALMTLAAEMERVKVELSCHDYGRHGFSL